MSENSLVELIGIKKTYRDNGVPVEALRGVDLIIERGEFTTVAGPSGSGKTTLLNIIGGLDNPTEGTVIFAGVDITEASTGRLSELRLHHIGFVFQTFNLIPVLSAIENVEYVMLLQNIEKEERHKRAMDILREVGLAGMEDRRPDELSGGQQQRVAVARAIVSRPDLVLADEPTANLDSKTGEELMEILLELNTNFGTTFLFSTHDPLVMGYARRQLTIKDGEIMSDERK
jgi:putative ABC transport system ATP-binding protein